MKLWLLMSRLGNGGLERVQINLANAFQKVGHDVCILAGQVENSAANGARIEVPVTQVAKSGAWQFIFGLIACLRKAQPDCILTTSNDVACLTLMLRPLLAPAAKVIVTQHLSLSGPLLHARGLSRLKLRLIYAAMRWLLPRADAVIAVSEGVADDIADTLYIERGTIDVVYNPIVTPNFTDLLRELILWPWTDENTPVIVFIGRLSREKRLDLLLAACRPLLESDAARLLVVGSGPQRDWLEAQIEARGLASKCHFTGFVHNVLPFIVRSNVLVLPSDYEGFGNVLVEAMACGVQVISTDCPHGPAEILAGGVYGQLVRPGNRSSLEEAIRRSLEGTFRVDPDVLVKRAGDFDLETATTSYLSIVTRVVKQANKA